MFLKMVLFTIFLTTNIVHASVKQYFTTISWDWILIVALIILFLLLLFSIIQDNKNRKKALSNFFEKEKCKKNGEYKYLNEINNERIESVEKLHNSISNIEHSSDEEIYKELKENCKSIFNSNKEEQIFLQLSTNSVDHKNALFPLNNLIDEIKQSATIDYRDNDLPQTIVADRNTIYSILFLLIKLQSKEHSLKNPKLNIELLSSNNINIEIPTQLPFNSTIKKVLKNGIKPLYNKKEKRYFGIYLYLIKQLLNKINGLLTIDSSNKAYKVSVTIPVDIVYDAPKSTTEFNKRLKESKKALIIADEKTTFILKEALEALNFTTATENFQQLNKEIPNFMEYDTIFMESNLFEPILTEYLATIKPLGNFDLIAISDANNKNIPTELVDLILEKPIDSAKINEAVITLYSSQLIDKESTKENPIEPIVQKEKRATKQKSVLIADDDRVNLHLLEYLLKQYGLNVKAVTDGLEALKALEKSNFDLIILDSIMPKLDGYQTIQKIRQDNRFNATPIIIHTSFSLHKSNMENIFQLGFDSYLPKPFNNSELQALLNRYVSQDIKQVVKKVDPNSTKEREKNLKEFLAIYSDSDRILEKYIKEKRDPQALALIKDIKEIANKINATELITTLDSIATKIENNLEVDETLLYSLSPTLHELKLEIAKELEELKNSSK